jgi:hypothetical protein
MNADKMNPNGDLRSYLSSQFIDAVATRYIPPGAASQPPEREFRSQTPRRVLVALTSLSHNTTLLLIDKFIPESPAPVQQLPSWTAIVGWLGLAYVALRLVTAMLYALVWAAMAVFLAWLVMPQAGSEIDSCKVPRNEQKDKH